MALDIERENQRHAAGWKGFVVFLTLAGGAVVLVLALMAIFLL